MRKHPKPIIKKPFVLILISLITLLTLISGGFLIKTYILKDDPAQAKKTRIFKNPSDAAAYQKWTGQIDKIGLAKTYENFKAETAKLSPGSRHTQAHIFGEVLYDKLGKPGIEICDDTFSYGCYHSFIGAAIQYEGTDIIDILNQSCLKKNDHNKTLGCQHGLGHGILAGLGYDRDNLEKSLELCRPYLTKERVAGCVGGVFMEYNFQTMLADDAKIRPYTPDNPHSTCTSLDDAFMPACSFQQSQWWFTAIPKNPEDKIDEIYNQCLKMNGLDLQNECFRGAGNHIGEFVNWDPKQAIYLCNRFKTYDSQVLCKSQAANVFNGMLNLDKEARMLCNDMNTTDKDACYRNSGLKFAI
jgi:hypothetical protein